MNSGELKVDVPLASVESEEEDDDGDRTKSTPSKERLAPSRRLAAFGSPSANSPRATCKTRSASAQRKASPKLNLEDLDSVAGSLEDLVNSFDDKLTKIFHDYQEQVDKIAPVQVRSQEEIMNECQVWWTITGNFGNMMPIDWSKSTARAKQLPALNLKAPMPANCRSASKKVEDDLEDEDDIVAADLDMHSLILDSDPTEGCDPVKSAEEVIKEIDDLIESDDCDGSAASSAPMASSCQRYSRHVSHVLAGRKLEELTSNELSQILIDVETLVRDLSEELVSDLSVRDELEYEKELRNTFISLLLSVQSKRRQVAADGRRTAPMAMPSPLTYKYLTTVIPYQPDKGAPTLQALQSLVKILKAINEDSPAVPALLTDYILKVLCPS